MRRCIAGRVIIVVFGALGGALPAELALTAERQPLVVVPERVELDGNFARAQLLAMRPSAAGQDGTRSVPTTERSDDLTTQATYESSDPAVVKVSREGQLLAVANGEAEITVSANDAHVKVPVTVRGVSDEPHVGFS